MCSNIELKLYELKNWFSYIDRSKKIFLSETNLTSSKHSSNKLYRNSFLLFGLEEAEVAAEISPPGRNKKNCETLEQIRHSDFVGSKLLLIRQRSWHSGQISRFQSKRYAVRISSSSQENEGSYEICPGRQWAWWSAKAPSTLTL